MDFSELAKYGPHWLLIGLILLAVWKMIMWLMAFIKEDRIHQAIEREKWLCRLEKLDDNIKKTNNGIDNHDRRADERGKFVRAEHEKMMENLNEHYKILLRVNGEKK